MKNLTIFTLSLVVIALTYIVYDAPKKVSVSDETDKQNQNFKKKISDKKNSDASCEKCNLIKAAINNTEKNIRAESNVATNIITNSAGESPEPSIRVSELQKTMLSGVTYEMLQEKFLTESSDAEWANKVETDFTIALQETKNIETLLAADAVYEGIDCKATMCELSFNSLLPFEGNKAIRATKIAKVILQNGSFQGMRAKIKFTEDQEIKYMLYPRNQ